MGALLVSAVLHVDGSGRPCSSHPLSESELLNALDSLQRHLSPTGIRVSLSTRRVTVEHNAPAPDRDRVFFNGKEIAELDAAAEGGIDSQSLLKAGLEAASQLME